MVAAELGITVIQPAELIFEGGAVVAERERDKPDSQPVAGSGDVERDRVRPRLSAGQAKPMMTVTAPDTVTLEGGGPLDSRLSSAIGIAGEQDRASMATLEGSPDQHAGRCPAGVTPLVFDATDGLALPFGGRPVVISDCSENGAV